MTPALKKFWPETFRYAKKYSPFYREMFRGIKGVPRLEGLPTVRKSRFGPDQDLFCPPSASLRGAARP